MPTLVLLRHAKAEAYAAHDHDRRLAPEGEAQCRQVRAWLTEQGVVPDRVVVSSAVRARETWALAGVGTAPTEHDDRVYGAGVDDLREVIAETSPQAGTLVVVGHNPTLEHLAHALDDTDAARDRTNRGMPTAGVAVFELSGWDAGQGRLLAWRGR